MNKKLLIVLAAAALTAETIQASFLERLKAGAKQIIPTIQKEVAKKMEAKTYKAGATAGELQFTPISFQLRNKSSNPIWVSVAPAGTAGQVHPVGAGSAKSPADLELSVNIAVPNEISIWTSEPAGRDADKKYSVPANKTLYVTWDDSGLRQQTGEAMGIFGKTSKGGYTLKDNVKSGEIRQLS